MLRKRYVLLAAVLGAALAAHRVTIADTEPPQRIGNLEIATVTASLASPWGMAFLPDGRYLVTEQPGSLRIVSPDGTVSDPLGGVPEVYFAGQGGLLDVALHPRFADNAMVYLSYSEPMGGTAGTAVARARLADDRLEDLEVIFRQSPKLKGRNHYGSRLVFAPDGKLFVTLGDRYEGMKQAQTLDNTLGKVVRLNDDGSIPPDNPHASAGGEQAAIWTYGHRNQQGAAINPSTGALWVHEHGPKGGDEINIALPGRNFGWPVATYGVDYTGLKITDLTEKEGTVQPIHYWVPSIAPSGMAFYTADRFPEWKGQLFVGSLRFQQLVRLTLDGDRIVSEERLLDGLGERIRDVRQGPDGYLYLLTEGRTGRLLRVGLAGR